MTAKQPAHEWAVNEPTKRPPKSPFPLWGTIAIPGGLLWGTALGLFSTNYSFYFLLNWLPYYVVRERGFSTGEMASLTGSAYFISALSSIIASR